MRPARVGAGGPGDGLSWCRGWAAGEVGAGAGKGGGVPPSNPVWWTSRARMAGHWWQGLVSAATRARASERGTWSEAFALGGRPAHARLAWRGGLQRSHWRGAGGTTIRAGWRPPWEGAGIGDGALLGNHSQPGRRNCGTHGPLTAGQGHGPARVFSLCGC